jgi:hypothetical protein
MDDVFTGISESFNLQDQTLAATSSITYHSELNQSPTLLIHVFFFPNFGLKLKLQHHKNLKWNVDLSMVWERMPNPIRFTSQT